jgi:hypothetical protein
MNFTVSKIIFSLFDKYQAYKDKRVALTTGIIEGMKSIKLMGWELVF